jgi:hypothetical protein
MNMKIRLIYLLVFVLSMVSAVKTHAQIGTYDTLRVEAFITPEGDTIPQSWLPPAQVNAIQTVLWKKYWQNWTRLRNAVYVTYPYAKTAGKIISEVNLQLAHVPDERLRKQIIKSREKELKRDFADKVTMLSVYQGKVLMKLINREAGNNCYEIIREFKGGFNAGFWQAVAFVFGSNLKQQYDAKGDDKEIEKIVLEVQKLYGYKG